MRKGGTQEEEGRRREEEEGRGREERRLRTKIQWF